VWDLDHIAAGTASGDRWSIDPFERRQAGNHPEFFWQLSGFLLTAPAPAARASGSRPDTCCAARTTSRSAKKVEKSTYPAEASAGAGHAAATRG
jgi:hypothetical protein